ncbi:hypothetical protein CEE37_06070 [candidate division LCP-89 bacterium B3_LCP]|uniref:POTRA domain-containing protein n=1 Tax=candidate division LCP-89 bacterium B3_LCP TaxID=2012998 RepID=A0A532V266_UNCL8|nr:MAG: hypothetical protein CEE37_06070 [candidate division LCP-89 bacterium B3_LCP]
MYSIRHKLFYTVFCLFALGYWQVSFCAEPLLRSVSIYGNREFSQRKIIAWSGLKIDKPFPSGSEETAAKNILSKFALEGFYFSRIDSVIQNWSADSTKIDLDFYLTEGHRLILKSLQINGDTMRTGEEAPLQSRPGSPLFGIMLQADLQDILDAKQETGYPFARLIVKELQLSDDSLDVITRMTSGPIALLESVRVLGVTSTKPNAIAREARIVSGEPYNPNRLEKARQRIRKLPFVEEVSQPALIPLGSDRYDVMFQVQEAHSNSFDGVIGYQPGTDGEKGEVTGLLNLTFMNLFGTGRKAKILWERTSEFRQALELYYEEPWVLGFPFNLWGEFRQEIQDSLYLERQFSGGVAWAATDVLSLVGSVFQEEVLPDSSGREYLGLNRSKTWGGALEVKYDNRDYPDNPIRGLLYTSLFSTSEKSYEPSANLGDLTIRRYHADLDWCLPIYKRQILNLQFHGRFLESDEDPIPQPDIYRLGGAQTLRGYREDQFLGHLIGWGTAEYRLWMDKVSRIYAFLNLGYYEYKSPSDSSVSEGWPWGYGIGFRQGTRLGIIGFDFALGEDDVLATAKVHFRLINRF